jgi:hypothetical protein
MNEESDAMAESLENVKALYATVKDIYEESKRLHEDLHQVKEAYKRACENDSTREERLALQAEKEPLSQLYRDALSRRDRARRAFWDARELLVGQILTALGLPGHDYGLDPEEQCRLLPELYEP